VPLAQRNAPQVDMLVAGDLPSKIPITDRPMNNIFTLKSIILYSCLVLPVVGLFSAVTAYGSANLRAPRKIDGRYLLDQAALPECMQSTAIALTIQQSGIYLNGSLLPIDASEQIAQIAEERPSLTGQWSNDQPSQTGAILYGNTITSGAVINSEAADLPLTLTGTAPYVSTCTELIAITADINQDRLVGVLRVGSSQPVSISAKREALIAKPEAH
jgi:hypothetical protein